MVLSENDHFETTRMPDGIWIKIFADLPCNDYLRMRLTCKHFAFLSTVRKLKKWKLKLDGEDAVRKFKAAIDEIDIEMLPISVVALHNLSESEDLGYILKKLSNEIRCLYLVDSLVFENVNDAKLNSLEELYMYFDKIEWDIAESDVYWDIKSYKRLHTLDFALRNNFNLLCHSILSQLIEAKQTMNLRSITLSLNRHDEALIMDVLRLNARHLKYLNIFCRTETSSSSYTTMCKIFSNMDSLESLFLSGCCTDALAIGIFKSLPHKTKLKTIGFEFTIFDTDEILKLVIAKWPDTIADLKFVSNRVLSKAGLSEIWKLRASLKSLEIQYQQTLTLMDVVQAVAQQKNAQLQKLSCNCLGRMCDESVKQLSLNLPNMEELELTDLRVHLTNRSLGYVFENLKALRRLRIGCASKHFPAMSQLTQLEELNLNYCTDLRSALAGDLVFPNLRKLNLNSCRKITSGGFIQIAQNCPALEVLELNQIDALDDDAVNYICRNLKKLEKLNIKNCDNVSDVAVLHAVCKSGIRKVNYKYDEYDGTYYWLK